MNEVYTIVALVIWLSWSVWTEIRLWRLFKMAGPPPRKARTVEKKPKLGLLDD